jgi:DNA polymerase III epsilon subunit-like protein
MITVFMDTETTSLRHDRRAWEIGLILRRDGRPDHEQSWFIRCEDLDLGNADLGSLKIGKFYDRHPDVVPDGHPAWRDRTHEEGDALLELEELTRAATIVGAVPWFDTDVLGQRMRANDICPSWHYHLVDVETFAAGALGLPPPWNLDTLLDRYGLKYDEADRHTALGDARMVRDLYDAVLSGRMEVDG